MTHLKTDKLAVRCYARHGDMCGIDQHHDSLGCASGFKAEDMVLVAQFAYLAEASDYCRDAAHRGVNMRLVSRIVPSIPFVEDFLATDSTSPVHTAVRSEMQPGLLQG